MKSRFSIAMLLLIAALATSVCSKSEPDVGQLEELPKDIADNLKRVPDSDLLISIAPVTAPSPLPTPGKPSGPIFARACSETQNFLVQVIYPVTVCSRRDLVASTFLAAAPPRTSGPVATGTVKNFKLTAFDGKILPSPFLCQTRNGPWLATIVRTILVPATMRLLGDWNWYLPRWLRRLPDLHVEGIAEPVGEPELEPAPVG